MAGHRLEVSPREFDLLETLVSRAGRVVRRGELLRRICRGPEPGSERVVDAHSKSIRRKLGDSRGCIETVRGVGYRFSDTARAHPGRPEGPPLDSLGLLGVACGRASANGARPSIGPWPEFTVLSHRRHVHEPRCRASDSAHEATTGPVAPRGAVDDEETRV